MLYPRTGVPLQEVVDLPGAAVRVRLDEPEGDPAGRALYHRRVHALAADLDVYSSKVWANPNTSW